MISNFFSIKLLAIITITSSIFISCDDEISDVGADAIIGVNIDIEENTFSVEMNQVNLENNNLPQTNNLGQYLLGINSTTSNESEVTNSFNLLSTVFGTTQDQNIEDTTTEDDEGLTTITDFTLESATLVLPFKYTLIETVDGNERYTFDSKITGDIHLTVQQLNNRIQNLVLDATENLAAVFYSNGSSSNTNNAFNPENSELENSLAISTEATIINSAYFLSENSGDFQIAEGFDFFNDDDDNDLDYDFQINITNEDDSNIEDGNKSLLFPAIRIPLNATVFNNIITQNGITDTSILSDNDVKNSFRGIFIDTTNSDGITEIDLNNTENLSIDAGIQLVFSKTVTGTSDEASEETETVVSTFLLNNTPADITTTPANISLINREGGEEEPTTDVSDVVLLEEEQPTTNANEDILLEGGLGSFATITINIPSNLIPDPESEESESNLLLNNATLKLTVNENSEFFSEENLPNNIMVTALESGSPLIDYNNQGPEEHLIAIREQDEDGNFTNEIIRDDNNLITYEINITEHLAGILNQDSENIGDDNDLNVTLAISTTSDITNTNITRIQTSDIEPQQFINEESILSFGIVPLYNSSETGENTENTENTENIQNNENLRPRITLQFISTNNEN